MRATGKETDVLLNSLGRKYDFGQAAGRGDVVARGEVGLAAIQRQLEARRQVRNKGVGRE
jgi:hypothetical protein